MSEPAQKCENCGIFKQNYALKVFVAFKTANSCCFSLRGNLNFPDFLQKKFYNINYRNMEKNIDISHTNKHRNRRRHVKKSSILKDSANKYRGRSKKLNKKTPSHSSFSTIWEISLWNYFKRCEENLLNLESMS